MSKDTWVQEPSSTPCNLKCTILGQNKVKIEVSVESETFKQGFNRMYELVNECRVHANGYDQIAEVAYVRAVPVSDKMPVTEDEVTEPIGVSADRKSNPIPSYFGTL